MLGTIEAPLQAEERVDQSISTPSSGVAQYVVRLGLEF